MEKAQRLGVRRKSGEHRCIHDFNTSGPPGKSPLHDFVHDYDIVQQLTYL